MSTDSEEDVGIGVDFDQCHQETLFYSKSAERGDSEKTDSAVCLNSATREAFPAVLQNFNGFRKNNSVKTFHEINVERTKLYQREMQVYRKKTDGYLLTQQRLATHIIDFIDLPLKKNMRRRICTDRVELPLFTMSGNALEINPDYFFPLDSPYAKYLKFYLRTLAGSLTGYYRKLVEISEFVEQISERSQLVRPMLISVLSEWASEFLRDHSLRMDEMRSQRLADPLQVLARLKVVCEDIEMVRSLIGEDTSRQVWLWEDIEKSWNRVFLITQQEALVGKREVVRNLQQKWMTALLKVMDHIFEIGRVPPDIGHFVLHNDARLDAELLLCRSLETVNSVLWNEEIIETILEAVKCRIRLGIIEFPQKTFSNRFWELHSSRKHLKSFLTFVDFRSIFCETCKSLNYHYGNELLNELHRNDRFASLWSDLENVVIGSISQHYATTVFRSDSNVTNFSDAFWLACQGKMSKENMMHFTWIAGKSEFSCRLEPLLASFIRPDLIDVMNQCMQFAHSAYRTRELLVTMANDKDLLSRMTCPLSTLDVSQFPGYGDSDNINRVLRKRLRFFVFTLEQVVSHFRDLFVEKVRNVFKSKKEEIIHANRLRDVEAAVIDGHRQLMALVVRSGFRKPVHEAMDMFKSMTDEIRLRSVSNSLDFNHLHKCETDVRLTLTRLLSMGETWNNDKDSLFFHLSVRLGRLNVDNSPISP